METSEPGAARATDMPARRNTTPPIDCQRCIPIMSPLSVDPGLNPLTTDVIASVLAFHDRRRQTPGGADAPSAGYRPQSLAVLFGEETR